MPEKLKKWLENHPLPKNTEDTATSFSTSSAKAVIVEKHSDGGAA